MKNFHMPEIISPTLETEELERLHNSIKQIRQHCFCTENGTLEKSANSLKELFHSLNCDLCKFIDTLNESGAGWYLEGHGVTAHQAMESISSESP